MIRYVDPSGVVHTLGVEYRTVIHRSFVTAAVEVYVFRTEIEDGRITKRDALTIGPAGAEWTPAPEGVVAPCLATIPDMILARGGADLTPDDLATLRRIGEQMADDATAFGTLIV